MELQGYRVAREVFSQQLLDELANQKLQLDGIALWDECHQQINQLISIDGQQYEVVRELRFVRPPAPHTEFSQH